MSDHSSHFEQGPGGLVLTNAILLYRADSSWARHGRTMPQPGESVFASIHAISSDGEGPPVIASGTALTRAHLRQWTAALGRTSIPEILPDRILVAHPDLLAWWVPAQVRRAYFALSSPPADLQALSGRTVVPAPYPPTLFVATRTRLHVLALPWNRRPDSDTPLLHSPILNVFADGTLCWGNIRKPSTLSIAAIPQFESAVFDSWSTHPNPGQEFTVTGKGGLVRLWDMLVATGARRFPVRRMKPFDPDIARSGRLGRSGPVTFGTLIARGSRR